MDTSAGLASIKFLTGSEAGRTVQLTKPITLFGRNPTNDIVIIDPAVSAFHSQIIYHNGTWKISSVTRRHTLSVNNQIDIQETILQDQDIISLGQNTKILFLINIPKQTAQQLQETKTETPPSDKGRAIEVFYSYAHEDETLRNELAKQLSLLKRQGFIVGWHDRDINAGTDWEGEINKNLDNAQIILLLVSPDFIASDYCYDIEVKRAMERNEDGEATVIPIILRPADWQSAPFGKLQALPKDGKPVTSWSSPDEAFLDIAIGIRKTVTELLKSPLVKAPQRTKEQWLDIGNLFFERKEYELAVEAYEHAVHLDPHDADAHNSKGNALCELKRYDEALATFKQAIRLDPYNANAYNGKAKALCDLNCYNEALISCEQAIRLNPNKGSIYNNKGNILSGLKRYKEALTAYEQALRFDSSDVIVYGNKANALYRLRYYKEALAAYEQALHIEADNTAFMRNKIKIQKRLESYKLCKRQISAFFILLLTIVVYEILFYIDFFLSIRNDGVIDGGYLFNILDFFQAPVLGLLVISSVYILAVWLIIMKIKPLKPKETALSS